MEQGITYTICAKAEEALTAQYIGSGDLAVLATPALAAMAENAAMLCVAPHLEECQTSVGAEISLSHTRPSGIGASVAATACLTKIEGRRLTFHLSACDEHGTIGEGEHIRYIVNREHFMAKVKP